MRKTMNAKMFLLLTVLGFFAALLPAKEAQALNCTAAAAGLWSAPATWGTSCGSSTPGLDDTVTLSTGSFVVTVDGNFTVCNLSMANATTLKSLSGGSVTVAPTGVCPSSLAQFSSVSFAPILEDVTVTVASGSSLLITNNAGLTLQGTAGAMLVNKSTNANINRLLTLSSTGSVFTNDAGATVTLAAPGGINGAFGTFNNLGTVTVSGTVSIARPVINTGTIATTLSTSATFSEQVTNSGTISVNGFSAAAVFSQTVTNTSTGTINVGGTMGNNATFNGTLANAGTLNVSGGSATAALNGAATNSGTIDVALGNTANVNPASFAMSGAASSLTGDGTLAAVPSGAITLGAGQTRIRYLNADILNTGTNITPGGALAIQFMVITGNYTQSGTGTYLADVGFGNVYDSLSVTGTADFSGGTVQISFAANAGAGQANSIVTAATILPAVPAQPTVINTCTPSPCRVFNAKLVPGSLPSTTEYRLFFALDLAAPSVTFPNQTVFTTSLANNTTVSTSGVPVAIVSVTSSIPLVFVVGTAPLDCAASFFVGPSTPCSLSLTFAPSSLVPVSGTVTVSFADHPDLVLNVSGTGTPLGVVSVSPTPLIFTAIFPGSSTQSVTVNNNSASAVSFPNTSVTGPYSISTTCPVSPATLATSLSCVYTVIFTPTGVGAAPPSSLSIPLVPTASLSVALNGTATAAAAAPLTLVPSFTPPAVGVNAQSIFTLTINNTDSISPASNLVLSNIAPTSGASFAASPIGGNCGGTAAVTSGVLNLVSGSVPASGSCFITVPISSPTAGLYNVNLPVGSATSVIGGQAGFVAATLSVQNLPTIVATPVAATTLTFSAVAPNTTSPVQTVSLLNSGSAVATLSKTVTGPNASLFAVPDNCAGTINPAGTCVFSVTCTPIAVGSFTATLSITHNAPNTPSPISYPLSCTSSVTPVAPAIVGTPPNATVGVAYSFGFTATGTAPITWSTTGALPPGITFNSASGVLSGTPLTAGTFSFSVVAANGTLPNATKPVSIVVAPIPVAPTISGTPPSGAISVPYSFSFTASGTAPATWTSSGTLPPGLTLNASTGAIAGIPTTAGSFTFSVTAANGTLPNATQPVTIVIGAVPAAVFSSLTTSASFPNQVINRTSPPQIITITNNGNASLNLSGISISNPLFSIAPAAAAPVRLPTEAAKLGRERALNLASPAVTIAADPPCVFSASASIPPASSCSISLVFAPTAVGMASGTLTINHNAAVFPATSATAGIALSGTGVLASVPMLEFVPANLSSINFGSQIINTTTQPARTITIKNSGQVPLNISTLSFSNPQFSRFAGAPGNCALSALGSPISAGAIPANTTCEINVVFTPNVVSAVVNGTVGKLTITHNGVPALAASAPVPATSAVSEIDLIGTGIAAPVASIELDAPALAFGPQVVLTTSAAKTVTVTNRGNAPLSIGAITVTGGNNARPVGTLGGTCSATVAVPPGLGCTVTLTFSPGTVGDKTGTLSIVSNASNLPPSSNGAITVLLTGTGIAAPVASIELDPLALAFGSHVILTTSAAKTVTVTNRGNAPLSISTITVTDRKSVV